MNMLRQNIEFILQVQVKFYYFPLSLPPPSLSSSSSSLTWEWSVSYDCTTFLICASHGTHHFLSHSIDLIFSTGLPNTEFMSVSNLNLYPCPRKQLVRWINNNNKKRFKNSIIQRSDNLGLPWWSSDWDFPFLRKGYGFDPWSRS